MMPARDSLKTVAALHSQSEGGGVAPVLRVVLATLIPGGMGSEWQVSHSRTFTSGEAEALSAFLDEADAQVLIHVVPAGMTVARTATLPEMAGGGEGTGSGGAEVAEALGLIAESELPSALPWYRRAAGAIAPGRGGSKGGMIGLLTGWPERDEDTSSWRRTWVGPQAGVSEVAALAGLARCLGGVDRAMTVDPSTGGVGAICVCERIVARVVRLSSADDGSGGGARALESAAREVLNETAHAAGIPAAPGKDAHGLIAGRLLLDPEPTSPRIGGAPRDRAWLGAYGLAAGAIALLADPSPATHGLVGLYLIEPKTRPPVLARVTEFLGRPRRAAAIIAACVLVLLALPLGAALARVRMLEKSVTDEPALMARNAAAEKELAFYKLLREKRWPMTKLLADVAGAAPVGVTVESIELGQGEGLVVRGKAETSDLVTTFRENLGKTKVFAQVTTPSTNPGFEGVQFQLTAKVPTGAAVFPAPPIDDFAAKTLAERLYGESARGHSTTRGGARADRSTTSSRPDRNGRSGRTGESAGSSSPSNIGPNAWPDRPRTPAPTVPKAEVVIPPPLTDAQIAAMDRTTAMLEFGKRRKAASQAGIDAETKRRLTDEAEKAQRRMQEANQQTGGAK